MKIEDQKIKTLPHQGHERPLLGSHGMRGSELELYSPVPFGGK